ncbi:MAG: HDOD domain-containing protein [Betaproteobacteria bacterium]|nr:HDOD domain-containing protein [Betaproteobacteria bacterium]
MDNRISIAPPMDDWPTSVDAWVALVSRSTLPVLASTGATLDCFRRDADEIDVHGITEKLPDDPLFVAKLFAYLARARGLHASADVGTVGRAIFMLGTLPFLRAFEGAPTISRQLMPDRDARRGLIRAIRRARRAARFAHALAIWRNDNAAEEVSVAALLHDIADMLVWILAPRAARKMQALQGVDSTLRSKSAQRLVLGFELQELLVELAARWHLPEQIVTMMIENAHSGSRGQIVALAVNLARHSTGGWDNAALPDDFRDIARLLMVNPVQARAVVQAPPIYSLARH